MPFPYPGRLPTIPHRLQRALGHERLFPAPPVPALLQFHRELEIHDPDPRPIVVGERDKVQGFVSAALKGIFSQSTQQQARQALRKAVELLSPRYPAAATLLQEAEEDVLAYMTFPEKHWRQIHSTLTPQLLPHAAALTRLG